MRRLIIILLLMWYSPVSGEVLFEDNFDDHSDWSPTQPIFPNTQANNSSDGGTDGTTACTGCPDGNAKYAGYYIASSAWNGYKGEDTIQISADNHRGPTGKGATFWMEPINTTNCDGGTGWCSDGQLAVRVPANPDEIYVRFYIKFQPDWVWDITNASSSEKFVHITHLHDFDGVSMWKFFEDGNHFPATVYNISNVEFYGFNDSAQYRAHIRFQSSYQGGTVPDPTYLVNNDYDPSYDPGGTGDQGKLWAESIGDGEWHCIELRLKGNSAVGEEDGAYQIFIDGNSIYNREIIAYADEVYKDTCDNCIDPPSDFVGWNWISIGGNMANGYYPISTQIEQYYIIDDLVISTTYVGPDYVIGEPLGDSVYSDGASIITGD